MSKTKKSLVLSCLSMLLCVSMLIGSTFAWFTDNASTAVNTIQSGILDVELNDLEGNSVEGQTLEWVRADGRTDLYWEPGCTYYSEPFIFKNNSNLAIEWMLSLTAVSGDTKLLEVLDIHIYQANVSGEGTTESPYRFESVDTSMDFQNVKSAFPYMQTEYMNGADVAAFVIYAHMHEDASNDYQNLKLNGVSVLLQAKQFESESDSFGDQYDKDAAYDIVPDDAVYVRTVEEINAATAKYVVLMDDITLTEVLTIAEKTLNLDGHTITGEYGVYLKDDATLTNGTVAYTGTGSAVYVGTAGVKEISGLTITGGNVGIEIASNSRVATIENCNILNVTDGVKSNKGNYNDVFDVLSNTTINATSHGVKLWLSKAGTIKNCDITGGEMGVGIYGLAGDNHPTGIIVIDSKLVGTSRFGFSYCDTACWDNSAYRDWMPASNVTVENCDMCGGEAGACIDQSHLDTSNVVPCNFSVTGGNAGSGTTSGKKTCYGETLD